MAFLTQKRHLKTDHRGGCRFNPKTPVTVLCKCSHACSSIEKGFIIPYLDYFRLNASIIKVIDLGLYISRVICIFILTLYTFNNVARSPTNANENTSRYRFT